MLNKAHHNDSFAVSAAALSADDLNARIPVWQALSVFWLDTKLQDIEFNYIARIIAESPYSLKHGVRAGNYVKILVPGAGLEPALYH